MRLLILICAAAIALGAAGAHSEALPSFKQQRISMVQAAILYQLTRYIEWSKDSEEELIVCVHDNPDIQRELKQLLQNKIHHRRLKVADGVSAPASCDFVYIPQRELKDYAQIAAAYEDRQVLLVSDAPDFIDMGGMIALVDREGRIGIELNMQMLQTANFTINPSLIDIATRVIK